MPPGANAILALRYDANEMAAAVTEVLAYGTAVVVEETGEAGGAQLGRGSRPGRRVEAKRPRASSNST